MKNNQRQSAKNGKRAFGFLTGYLVFTLILFVCAAVAQTPVKPPAQTAAAAAAQNKGRKFGLFVGINQYTDGINPLSGCVNDAKNMQAAMVGKYAFKKTDTTLLIDAQATRAGIIEKIKMYEKLAKKGDLFVFHYSGHGTLFPDQFSEEKDETELIFLEDYYPRDRYDSALVPVDANLETSGKPWANLILDDELYAMMSAFTKKGAQVVFISDSCHSGSIARAQNKGVQIRTTPLIKVLGVQKFEDIQFKKPATTTDVPTPPKMNGLYITMSGSKDNEFSLDAGEGGIPMGLFTSTLLKTLNLPTAKNLTYAQLVKTVSPQVAKTSLGMDNDQNPQLDARFGNANAKIFSLPSVK